MKYLKTYEMLSIKFGDYVVCNEIDSEPEITEFTSNNIGQYIGENEDGDGAYQYNVRFENVPDNLQYYFATPNYRSFRESEIRLATPEEIVKFKILNNANKYNL